MKTSAVDRGSGPFRPQTAGPRSRRRRLRDGGGRLAFVHLQELFPTQEATRVKGFSEPTELFLARPADARSAAAHDGYPVDR